MKKIYLLTTDVEALLTQWVSKNGLQLPPTEFFSDVDIRLIEALKQALGENVQVACMSIGKICAGVQELVSTYANDLPLVIMDKLFRNLSNGQQVLHYESTRVMHYTEKNFVLMGEGPRPGCPSLAYQAKAIAHALGASLSNPKRIALIDDGCFGGNSLQHCMKTLAHEGVETVCAFIGILKQSESVKSIKIPLHAYLTFGDELLDWLCQRDLLIGIPEGGRVLNGTNHLSHVAYEIGVPYLSGFGDPCDWASLPQDKAAAFSHFAVKLSLEIFSAIEQSSQKQIYFKDIPRWPFYTAQPVAWKEDDHFIQTIQRVLLH